MTPSRLSHLADEQARSRGLQRAEFLDCVVRSVEESYRLRGRIVRVSLDEDDADAAVHGVELADSAEWVPLRRVDAPPAWLLQQTVDEFLASREQAQQRRLALARAVAAYDDHVLVELASDEGALSGQVAVLPRAQIAPRDAGWELGAPARFVVVRRHVPERGFDADSVEPWRGAAVHWLASRTDIALPRLLVRHYFDVDANATCYNGTCMLVVPAAGDEFAKLVGKDGTHATLLRDVLGIERVFVAREPLATEAFARLACAVSRVTGLRRRDYAVKRTTGPAQLPRVVVDRRHMPRLVGRGGQNLLFIRWLSRVEFTHVERPKPTGMQAAELAD